MRLPKGAIYGFTCLIELREECPLASPSKEFILLFEISLAKHGTQKKIYGRTIKRGGGGMAIKEKRFFFIKLFSRQPLSSKGVGGQGLNGAAIKKKEKKMWLPLTQERYSWKNELTEVKRQQMHGYNFLSYIIYQQNLIFEKIYDTIFYQNIF